MIYMNKIKPTIKYILNKQSLHEQLINTKQKNTQSAIARNQLVIFE